MFAGLVVAEGFVSCCFVLSLVGAGGGRDRPRDIILQLLRLCACMWLACLCQALQDQSCKTVESCMQSRAEQMLLLLLLEEEDKI